MSETFIRGSCLCGAVEYRVAPGDGNFQYCHCSRCRKSGGAAHAANLIVPSGRFEWTRGGDNVQQYVHAPAKRYCNAFCRTCGSKLPWRSRDGRWMIVTAGTLDDDPGLSPARSIFWASRPSWYRQPGDLPCFEELPPRRDGANRKE
jgi:hypothetical protein